MADSLRGNLDFTLDDDSHGSSRRLLASSLRSGGENALEKYSNILGVELSNLFLCCFFLFLLLIVSIQGRSCLVMAVS
jgi:hypothetical protein